MCHTASRALRMQLAFLFFGHFSIEVFNFDFSHNVTTPTAPYTPPIMHLKRYIGETDTWESVKINVQIALLKKLVADILTGLLLWYTPLHPQNYFTPFRDNSFSTSAHDLISNNVAELISHPIPYRGLFFTVILEKGTVDNIFYLSLILA